MRLKILITIPLLLLSACASLPTQDSALDRCGLSADEGWQLLSSPPNDSQKLIELAQNGKESFSVSNLFWFENTEKQLMLCHSRPLERWERAHLDQMCTARLWRFEQESGLWQELLAPVIVCHR